MKNIRLFWNIMLSWQMMDSFQKKLYDVFSEFRLQRFDATYPPYHQGDYLEEYFVKKFEDEKPNTKSYFIPVHWTAVFNYKVEEGLGPGTANHNLRSKLFECIANLDTSKSYFTVSTHDDAPQGPFPSGVFHFVAGGNSKLYPQAPIPLIASGFQSYNDFQKMVFCSFVGSVTHPLRASLLNSLSGKDGYLIQGFNWEPSVSQDKANYFKSVMEQSRFTLCPRGYGATSYRLYESIQLGSIPVYVSDKHMLPWADELDWSEFCVVVHQASIPGIDMTLKSFTEADIRRMQKRLKEVYNLYFTIPAVYNQIIKRV